ncbi:serine hydrolase domain-containing protein [Streptomyces lasiicapitis]|uniref:serine hydrolase domain-containing protein n=1 Tax=Streptomyces lasiicapitis TaxID=1923961 RepID=UPI00365C8EBF
MERTKSPGSAYAVVRGDEVAHRRTWGSDGNGAPVTPRTPFLVGSLAKPVTAMAVMRLVEEGRVRLDDPVREHLPWFRASGEGGERITVRHLLNQTSGISEREGLERSDRGDNEPGGVERRARSLGGVPLSGPPGERHRYSAAA